MNFMGRVLVTGSLCWLISGLFSLANAFTNEPDGFRGIVWGSSIEQLQSQMVLKENDGDDKYYARTGDKLSIGSAELSSIAYHFYKGIFGDVFIKVKPTSELDIIQTLRAQFGEGDRPNQFMDRYLWMGSTGQVILDCKPISDECMIFISSVRMKNEREADKARAAAGAKKDF